MRWRSRLLAGVAVVVAATGAAAYADTALALNAATGGCSASGYNGNGATYWSWNAANNTNRVSYFQYRLEHGSDTANKSNVNINHKEDRSFASDPTLYSWNSPDDRIFAHTYTQTPPFTVELSVKKKQYTNYEFIFDRNNATDPSCTARTSTITG